MKREQVMIRVIICITILFLMATPASAVKAGPYSFIKKLLPLNSKTLRKISDEIPADAIIKKTDISTIKKSLPDIDVKRLNPDVLKLASVGGEIAKTNKFADKFINNAPNPADIISQYSKYGKSYLETAENFSKTVVSYASSLSKVSPKQLSKIGNLSKDTIIKFKDGDFANSAFVSVVKRTGKIGYETTKKIVQLTTKYPRSSIAAGLLIWFSTDPEGFLDSVKDVGSFASSFATQTTSALAEGAGEGLVTSLTTKLNDPVKQRYMFVGCLFLVIIVALSLRITRRLVFFPFRIIASKLNTYMDQKEDTLGKPKHLHKAEKKKPQMEIGLVSSSGKAQDKEAKGLF